MKASPNVEFLTADDGSFVGFILGADFTAEHEWGIATLYEALGIKLEASLYGLDRRRMTEPKPELVVSGECKISYYREIPLKKDPTRTRWGKVSESVQVLCVHDHNWWDHRPLEKRIEDYAQTFGANYDSREIVGAWDGKGFVLIAYSDRAKEALSALDEGLRRSDFALWTGRSNNPFGRGGLTVALASRVPTDGRETMERIDRDSEALLEAMKETGIEDRLRAAGKKWFALKPRWADEKHKTQHKVIFWLNPDDQKADQYGWFTVEELDAWIEGRGPVIKKSSTSYKMTQFGERL